MKSAFYTGSVILGLLATFEMLRRVRNRSGYRTTVAGAALAGIAMAFGTLAVAFADPLIVRPFAEATGVPGLATFISGIAVMGLLGSLLLLLAWWIFQGCYFTSILLGISTVSAVALCTMVVLFCQDTRASKYTGTSLKFLAADVARGGDICNRTLVYAYIYFGYVILAALVLALGFAYLALGAKGLHMRVRAGFWLAAASGALAIVYGGMSLLAVASGAHHHLILPFRGTETATAFSVGGVLCFFVAVLIPYIPVKPQRAR